MTTPIDHKAAKIIAEAFRDGALESVNQSVKELSKAYLDLTAKAELMEAALGFYASNNSWLSGTDPNFGDQITYGDLEEDSPITKRKYVGGKRAREVLERVRGK